jgi:stearoyl-CoA desaturase (delta-9 desaturase)
MTDPASTAAAAPSVPPAAAPAATDAVAGRADAGIRPRLAPAPVAERRQRSLEPIGVALMVLVHLGALCVFFVGVSPVAVLVAFLTYVVRMFGITGWFHRYFSHRSFKTSRPVQFLFALITTASVQRGPLWWAAHHRGHHAYTDTEKDVHSPRHQGFWWSHMGWFMEPENLDTHEERIQDFRRFPELRWLNNNDLLVSVGFAVMLWLLGLVLDMVAPGLGTSSWQMLVWGFFVSTTLLYHATYSVNSVCHVWGSRRFDTGEDSRNNFLVALATLGEGWHNNHHAYPRSTRQGFRWWEIDITYYGLWVMQRLGLVWDLQPAPAPHKWTRLVKPRQDGEAR